ncbi:carcinoembryonic antigen-related cell adhesion molecule 18 [Mesocricetus auratus]|uniref:Carcinoembryonic antigen-related cell adhesion molecule 18 n=1 Tax=Mesocricetus auratus TaxID=10036 RepID=A0ABM2WTH5_MESAU|nr:carcinoembryonic antigen-related cell adhesion molecule 18 [Mesocricetus auratus]
MAQALPGSVQCIAHPLVSSGASLSPYLRAPDVSPPRRIFSIPQLKKLDLCLTCSSCSTQGWETFRAAQPMPVSWWKAWILWLLNVLPTSNIKWYVNSVPTLGNNRMTISPDGKTLVIHRVSRSDRNLQCAIEDFPEMLQRSEEIPLSVGYGPDCVSLWTQPDVFDGVLTAVTGSSVQLECACFSRPEPKFHWIHNGSLLSVSEESMALPSLSWEQMGSYRCVVKNLETHLAFYRDVTIRSPGPLPAVHREFYISGSLVVFLIIFASLGSAYICGILVYTLIIFCSIR